MGDTGACAVAGALSYLSLLAGLSLFNNSISDAGPLLSLARCSTSAALCIAPELEQRR